MESLLSEDQGYELWWLILHMRRAMYKARTRELLQYGITPEEAAVLLVVRSIGQRATPAEISRWLLREPHSVSGLLRRMEKKGLLKRVKDLERRNLIRVTITKKGREAYNQSTERGSIHRIVSAISKEDCQKMKVCLEKLWVKALEELGTDYKPPFPSSP